MIEQWKPNLKSLIASGLKPHGMAYGPAIQSKVKLKLSSHKYLLNYNSMLQCVFFSTEQKQFIISKSVSLHLLMILRQHFDLQYEGYYLCQCLSILVSRCNVFTKFQTDIPFSQPQTPVLHDLPSGELASGELATPSTRQVEHIRCGALRTT